MWNHYIEPLFVEPLSETFMCNHYAGYVKTHCVEPALLWFHLVPGFRLTAPNPDCEIAIDGSLQDIMTSWRFTAVWCHSRKTFDVKWGSRSRKHHSNALQKTKWWCTFTTNHALQNIKPKECHTSKLLHQSQKQPETHCANVTHRSRHLYLLLHQRRRLIKCEFEIVARSVGYMGSCGITSKTRGWEARHGA